MNVRPPTDEQLGPLPDPTVGLGVHRWAYGPTDVRAIQRDTWARAIASMGKPVAVCRKADLASISKEGGSVFLAVGSVPFADWIYLYAPAALAPENHHE